MKSVSRSVMFLAVIMAFSGILVSGGASFAVDEESPKVTVSTSFGDQAVHFTLSGQYRVRYLAHDGLNFQSGGNFDVATQRTRLGVLAEIDDNFAIFIQLQDVRTWGEETNTLSDSDANQFDLHQGYADWLLTDSHTLRLGRQEIVWDEERLIGAVGWADQARSFDAARLIGDYGNTGFEMFYARLNEADVGNGDMDLAGLHLNHKFGDSLALAFLYIYDHDNTDPQKDRHTTGLWAKTTLGGFELRGEGYLQYGTIHNGFTDPGTGMAEDIDIAAYMGSVKAAYNAKNMAWKPGVSAWFDYLSGDDDINDDKSTVFDTLYATNHKWYGYMDLFLNIPKNTGQRGLTDYGAGLQLAPTKKVKLATDVHFFSLPVEDAMDDFDLGIEVDTTVVIKLYKHFKVVSGYSLFLPGDAMENIKKGDDPENWGFVMGDFKF